MGLIVTGLWFIAHLIRNYVINVTSLLKAGINDDILKVNANGDYELIEFPSTREGN